MDRLVIFPGSVRYQRRARARARDSRESVISAENSAIRPGSVLKAREMGKDISEEKARDRGAKEGTREKAKECGSLTPMTRDILTGPIIRGRSRRRRRRTSLTRMVTLQ